MTPVFAAHRREQKEKKKCRTAITNQQGRLWLCNLRREREHIDQLLSCCFLPHYQMTQKSVFGQAAYKDPSQLHNALCRSCCVGSVHGSVYTLVPLIYGVLCVLYIIKIAQMCFLYMLCIQKIFIVVCSLYNTGTRNKHCTYCRIKDCVDACIVCID